MSAFEIIVWGLLAVGGVFLLALVCTFLAARLFEAFRRRRSARLLGRRAHRFRGTGWGGHS